MATSTQQQITETLNELLAINIDAREGYKSARDGVDDARLKAVFQDLSRQRDKFATELANRILDLDFVPVGG